MRVLQFSTVAAICLAATITSAPAQDHVMRIATGSSSSGANCLTYLPSWAEKIKEESGGRIGYQMFCDGTLGKMGDTILRVQEGVAEVGWDNPLAYGDRFAGMAVVGLPGLFNNSEEAAGALWQLLEDGVIPQPEGVKLVTLQTFSNISLWTAKEIPDPANASGLKFGMGSKVRATLLETMGAIPLNLNVTEYYQAIARGTADGIFTTDSSIIDFQMADLIKYSYRGPFGGGVAAVFMNQAWYDNLPADLQQVVDNNIGYEASKSVSALIAETEQRGIQKAVDTQGMQLVTLTPEQVAAWQPAYDAAANFWMESTPKGPEILAAFRAAIEEERAN